MRWARVVMGNSAGFFSGFVLIFDHSASGASFDILSGVVFWLATSNIVELKCQVFVNFRGVQGRGRGRGKGKSPPYLSSVVCFPQQRGRPPGQKVS